MKEKGTIDANKWVKNTALLFYQIFSVDYTDKVFIKKLLSGGGGNSTLCATWMQLVQFFINHRISYNAYTLLLEKLEDGDKKYVRLENKIVYINKKLYRKYHYLFANNAKGAQNRISAGKYFHFDHNPSNKKVLELLNDKIKSHKDEVGFFEELTRYISSVQTLDLITVEEDDIRTNADRNSINGPLPSNERDALLNTIFFKMIEE